MFVQIGLKVFNPANVTRIFFDATGSKVFLRFVDGGEMILQDLPVEENSPPGFVFDEYSKFLNWWEHKAEVYAMFY